MKPGRLGVAVAVLMVLGLVAVPFVRDDGGGRGSDPNRPVPAPEGSVAVGVPELPPVYDPFDLRARTPAATQILALVLPQLFVVDPDGAVEGALVEDGTVEEVGATVAFRLREGARWSDGTPITADDLAFTLDVIRSDAWPGPVAGYDQVASITGTGRDVEMAFSEPLPGWERLFSGEDFVLPRHRLEGEDLATVWQAGPDLSGGPYALKGFTTGLDVVLEANDAWWGEGPGVSALRILTVPDATTLQQLFERGELDVAWIPAFTDRIRWAHRLDGVDVALGDPGGQLVSLWLNTEAVTEAVRIAALDLVDRDRFVTVLLGADEVAVATSWGMVADGPGWPGWRIDPAKAEGADATQMVFAHAEGEAMSGLLVRAVQRQARDTSLTFDSVGVLGELLDGEWLPNGEFDLALADETQWPEPCWRCRFGADAIGEGNWSRYRNGTSLAAEADGGDGTAGSRLERQLEQAGVVLPLWRPATVVVSRGVDGITANSWSPGPFYRVEEWVRTR